MSNSAISQATLLGDGTIEATVELPDSDEDKEYLVCVTVVQAPADPSGQPAVARGSRLLTQTAPGAAVTVVARPAATSPAFSADRDLLTDTQATENWSSRLERTGDPAGPTWRWITAPS